MRHFLQNLLIFGVFLLCIAVSSAALARGSASSSGYSVQVRSAYGSHLPTYQHRGQTYILGKLGQRYEIIVRNHTGRRVEAVISVDGLDAIDGKRADFRKRGYIVQPYGTVRVDGFRVSLRNVAAFRFSQVHDSYAGRKGQPRNIGVIGVAVFPERYRPPPRPVYRPYRPYRPYKWRPYWRRDGDEDDEARKDSRHQSAERPRASRGKVEADAPAAESAPGDLGATRGYGGAGNAGRRYSFEPKRRSKRKGLGTEFGERRYSPVHETTFRRANRHWPSAQLTVRYNDRSGLKALGINLNPWRPRWRERDLYKRETARPFRQSPKRRNHGFAEPPPGW